MGADHPLPFRPIRPPRDSLNRSIVDNPTSTAPSVAAAAAPAVGAHPPVRYWPLRFGVFADLGVDYIDVAGNSSNAGSKYLKMEPVSVPASSFLLAWGRGPCARRQPSVRTDR